MLKCISLYNTYSYGYIPTDKITVIHLYGINFMFQWITFLNCNDNISVKYNHSLTNVYCRHALCTMYMHVYSWKSFRFLHHNSWNWIGVFICLFVLNIWPSYMTNFRHWSCKGGVICLNWGDWRAHYESVAFIDCWWPPLLWPCYVGLIGLHAWQLIVSRYQGQI